MNMRESAALGNGSVRRPSRQRGVKVGRASEESRGTAGTAGTAGAVGGTRGPLLRHAFAGGSQGPSGPGAYWMPAALQAAAYSAVQMSAAV
ncbi:hypothetical protein SAMN05444521_2181 [Streptomyces sp. 3214.6]|nr:hypothetical protein SAMN05444521_2181 [Streptomyces sp. 3214.6]